MGSESPEYIKKKASGKAARHLGGSDRSRSELPNTVKTRWRTRDALL